MFDTYVSVYRASGTPAAQALVTDANGRPAQHLAVQIDRASDYEMAQAKNAWDWHGSYLFKIITYLRYPQWTILQEDVITDELNIDPDTGTNYVYTVVNRPKLYTDHQLLFGDVPVGH